MNILVHFIHLFMSVLFLLVVSVFIKKNCFLDLMPGHIFDQLNRIHKNVGTNINSFQKYIEIVFTSSYTI